MHVFISENTILNKKKIYDRHCNHTGKTIFLLPQRGSKYCIQTTYGEKSSTEREGFQIMI